MSDDNGRPEAHDDLNDPNIWSWVVGLVVLLLVCSVVAIATHDEYAAPQPASTTETSHRTEP